MTDPVDVRALTRQLLDARMAWDHRPSAAATANTYLDACAAFEPLGVSGQDMHLAINARICWTPEVAAFEGTATKPATPHIPATRRRSTPDAVQGAVNDLVGVLVTLDNPKPTGRHETKEAS